MTKTHVALVHANNVGRYCHEGSDVHTAVVYLVPWICSAMYYAMTGIAILHLLSVRSPTVQTSGVATHNTYKVTYSSDLLENIPSSDRAIAS